MGNPAQTGSKRPVRFWGKGRKQHQGSMAGRSQQPRHPPCGTRQRNAAQRRPGRGYPHDPRIKAITRKTIPASFDERIYRINLLIRGWINYFNKASIHQKLKKLDEWLRNRLRYCIWTVPIAIGRKKPDRKRKNLIRLGINQGQAYAWSRTRMGGWATAQSPILITTITKDRLKKRGYISMLEYFLQVK